MAVHTSSLTVGGGSSLVRFRPVTVSGGAYVLGAVAYTCTDLVIKTPITIDDAGLVKIDWDQIQDDPLLVAFLSTYNYKKAGTTTTAAEIVMNERGESYQVIASSTGGTGDVQLLAVEVYGSVQGANRKLFLSIGHVLASSGSYTQEGLKFNRPKLSFESVPADYNLVWAAGELASTAGYGIDAAVTKTITATNHYLTSFATKA